MEKKVKNRTSSEWLKSIQKKYEIELLNYDGWDKEDLDYSFNKEKITLNEFSLRLVHSKINCKASFFANFDFKEIE